MLIQASCKHLPLPDESVNLIFTDPPYLLRYLACYQWLADEAMRILKPRGFLLAMCGGSYINQIFRMFDDSGLSFYWKYENELTGAKSGNVWRNFNGKQMPVTTRLKSILAYSKLPSVARTKTEDVYRGTGIDKRFHHWGQDVNSARYYIDCFSNTGDLVVDPFCGGGTSLVAARLIDRRFIGFDVDIESLVSSRKRLNGTVFFGQLPMFGAD